MHARRSSRRSNNSEQPVVDEPIYVQADALRPAQWARLELSPRTGWVVGVVAPRRPMAADTVMAATAHDTATPALDVLIKVGIREGGVHLARLPLSVADTWRLAAPPSVAPDLASLEPSDAIEDEAIVARVLNEHCPFGTIGRVAQLWTRLHTDVVPPRDVYALVRVGEEGLRRVLEAESADGTEWRRGAGDIWKRHRPRALLNAGQRAMADRADERAAQCKANVNVGSKGGEGEEEGAGEAEVYVCGMRELVSDDDAYGAEPRLQRLEQAIALVLAELLELEVQLRDGDASPLLASVRAQATPYRGGGVNLRRQLLQTRWHLSPHPRPKAATQVASPKVEAAEPRDSHFEPHGSPVVALLRCQVHAGRGCGRASQHAVAFCTDAKAVLREMVASVESDARAMRLLIKQLGQLTEMTVELARKTRERLDRSRHRADALSQSLGLEQLRRCARPGAALPVRPSPPPPRPVLRSTSQSFSQVRRAVAKTAAPKTAAPQVQSSRQCL